MKNTGLNLENASTYLPVKWLKTEFLAPKALGVTLIWFQFTLKRSLVLDFDAISISPLAQRSKEYHSWNYLKGTFFKEKQKKRR